MYVSGPNQTCRSGTCANACSISGSTFDDVQVIVGSSRSACALMRRLVFT